MTASIFTKNWFSGDEVNSGHKRAELDATLTVSSSNAVVTNLGNLFSTIAYATVVSGVAGKDWVVAWPRGVAAATGLLTVLSSAVGPNITGSQDIGTLSATAHDIGVKFIGLIKPGYSGSTSTGA